jgi:hypothetical protein
MSTFSNNNRLRRLLGLLLVAVLALIACVSDSEVPIHGWWNDRGPVVRHEDFPTDCTLCHKGNTWTDLVDDFEFDHLEHTGYALEGAHAQAKCLRCHNDRGPVEVFARQSCAGCHTDVHNRLLGRQCQDCHGQDDWKPQGQVAEHQRTRFPLTGAHLATPCWRCHEAAEQGFFSLEDMRCESCHEADLAQVQDPDHFELGWIQDCERCHLASSWDGAGFRHPTLVSGCNSCHQADYATAQNPPHTVDSFPQNCEVCHNNDSWAPGVLDHPFPRVSIHREFTCEQCHPSIGQFESFSCTHCHWHEADLEFPRHERVKEFVWDNFECIACHPTGF